MDAERFERLLDAHGAAPEHWPAAERAEAEAFAARPEGRAAMEAARELDAWLASSRAPAPSYALRSRVLAAAPPIPSWSAAAERWKERAARLWAPGAGLAAAGLAGLLFGAALSGAAVETPTETLLAEAFPPEAGTYEDAALLPDEAL